MLCARWRVLAIIPLLFALCTAHAQQNDRWRFGNGATLDFSSGTVIPGAGPMNTSEGSACVSDQNGAMLFFTDGESVWNRNNSIMPNGNQLLGGSSSTQSAIIVPRPGQCGDYFIFTVEDHTGGRRASYSVVDMCLNGGSGDVIPAQKNILMDQPVAEKVTVVPHANGSSYWILTHGAGNAEFHAFELTASGLAATPVVSTVGSVHGYNAVIGPLKASHDGTRLVNSVPYSGLCQMFDFDPATGLVTNMIDLVATYGIPGDVYGIEFSPNDHRLYVATISGTCSLFQIDLLSANTTLLASMPGSNIFGALQLAPNGKIYMARRNEQFLDIIDQPDVLGVACNYLAAAQPLANATYSRLGLPNFMPTTITNGFQNLGTLDLGQDTMLCGDPSMLLSNTAYCSSNFIWQNGSTSNSIQIDTAGIYWVQEVNDCGVYYDTLTIASSYYIEVDIGPDTVICPGTSITLLASSNGADYSWQDGSTSPTLTTALQGTYWVMADSLGCIGTDSVQVSFLQPPSIELGNDTTICSYDQLILDLSASNFPITWQDGSTGGTHLVQTAGLYIATTPWTCGSESDSIVVDVIHLNDLLDPDTVLCTGTSITLSPNTTGGTLTWQDGSQNDEFIVTLGGTYWVVVDSLGCTASDTIAVSAISLPNIDLGPDQQFCDSAYLVLDVSGSGSAAVQWQNGSTDPTFIVQGSGQYWVQGSSTCGQVLDTINVMVTNTPTPDLGSDTALCPGAFIVLSTGTSSGNITWGAGSNALVDTAYSAGTYTVTVNDEGCIGQDTVNISLAEIPIVDLGNDITQCEGDPVVLNFQSGMPQLWSNGSSDTLISVVASGNYWLQVPHQCGVSSDTVHVAIIPYPSADLGNDTVLCDGTSFSLHIDVPSQFYVIWNNGTVHHTNVIDTPGLVWVSVDDQGCTTFDSLLVTGVELPVLEIGDDMELCTGEMVRINAPWYPDYSYLWSNGATDPMIEVTTQGLYEITIEGLCGVFTDDVHVELIDCSCPVFIPNAFTPDEDGINDQFMGVTSCTPKEWVLQIFDRWGELIFTGSQMDQAWDGNFRGDPVAPGVYNWRLIYRMEDPRSQQTDRSLMGHVTLIR